MGFGHGLERARTTVVRDYAPIVAGECGLDGGLQTFFFVCCGTSRKAEVGTETASHDILPTGLGSRSAGGLGRLSGVPW